MKPNFRVPLPPHPKSWKGGRNCIYVVKIYLLPDLLDRNTYYWTNISLRGTTVCQRAGSLLVIHSSCMLMDCILLKKENRVNRLWVLRWLPWYIAWSFYRLLTLHFQTLAYRKLKTCHRESHDQWSSCHLGLAVTYYLLFSLANQWINKPYNKR